MSHPWTHHRVDASGTESGHEREHGFVGGLEVLPFGVLIFVAGALLITNAWAVVDAKMATTAAAREAARVYVEAPSSDAGAAAAHQSAEDAMRSYGRNPAKLDLALVGTAAFERCERITFRAEYRVPALSLPFGIGFGHGFHVGSQHSEIVDPLRTGLPAANVCGY